MLQSTGGRLQPSQGYWEAYVSGSSAYIWDAETFGITGSLWKPATTFSWSTNI